MIALASDCLVFQLRDGERIPFSAEMITVEIVGEAGDLFDAEFVRHASYAVFHYFRHELRRECVSLGEFAQALEKVLRGFMDGAKAVGPTAPRLVTSDLSRLACESGKGCELFFFPRLREEMRRHLQGEPSVVHFSGLRRCVKQLVGARRWTARCQSLKEQILQFLRLCAAAQPPRNQLALLVD